MLRRGKVATTSVASGRVEISHAAIASLVHGAVLEAYGVVGMAPSGLRGNLAYYLRQDDPRRGIMVEMDDERIVITLYVILERGTHLRSCAEPDGAGEVCGRTRARHAGRGG